MLPREDHCCLAKQQLTNLWPSQHHSSQTGMCNQFAGRTCYSAKKQLSLCTMHLNSCNKLLVWTSTALKQRFELLCCQLRLLYLATSCCLMSRAPVATEDGKIPAKFSDKFHSMWSQSAAVKPSRACNNVVFAGHHHPKQRPPDSVESVLNCPEKVSLDRDKCMAELA